MDQKSFTHLLALSFLFASSPALAVKQKRVIPVDPFDRMIDSQLEMLEEAGISRYELHEPISAEQWIPSRGAWTVEKLKEVSKGGWMNESPAKSPKDLEAKAYPPQQTPQSGDRGEPWMVESITGFSSAFDNLFDVKGDRTFRIADYAGASFGFNTLQETTDLHQKFSQNIGRNVKWLKNISFSWALATTSASPQSAPTYCLAPETGNASQFISPQEEIKNKERKLRQALTLPFHELTLARAKECIKTFTDALANDTGATRLIITLEQSPLAPSEISKAFPKAGDDLLLLKTKYYEGVLASYQSLIEAAKPHFKDGVSVLGWAPTPELEDRLDLEKPTQVDNDCEKILKGEVKPTDWSWACYGKKLSKMVDAVHPAPVHSKFGNHWVENYFKNLDRQIPFNVADPEKPLNMIPYLPMRSPGTDPTQWPERQPLPLQAIQAMTIGTFFSGAKGIGIYEAYTPELEAPTQFRFLKPQLPSGPSTHLRKGAYAQISKTITAVDRKNDTHTLNSGTAIKILDVAVINDKQGFESLTITRIDPETGSAVGKELLIGADLLLPHLRPLSEPFRAVFEGMALVRSIQTLLVLSHPDAGQKNSDGIIIRVVSRKSKKGQILATIFIWDPAMTGAPRQANIKEISGKKVNLTLPASTEPRVYLIEIPQQKPVI